MLNFVSKSIKKTQCSLLTWSITVTILTLELKLFMMYFKNKLLDLISCIGLSLCISVVVGNQSLLSLPCTPFVGFWYSGDTSGGSGLGDP